MLLVDPRSARIHEPTPRLDHLVLRLLSRTFAGTLPSLPLADTLLIGRLSLHVCAFAELRKLPLISEAAKNSIAQENRRKEILKFLPL